MAKMKRGPQASPGLSSGQYSRSQLNNVGRSDGSSSQVNLGDITLSDINPSNINPSDEHKRARHTTSLRHIQASTRCLFMDHEIEKREVRGVEEKVTESVSNEQAVRASYAAVTIANKVYRVS
ncbi:hypothetical protein NDA11_002909 [Ustilago hordei]|uniref:Uncharacterized protein n=1 Tax=Ustilago hordei TaxID=120017 RepID=I2FMQ1_USTHO|nr:hypothetical protein NDA10_003805 [Ustilago hordei]KAJ1573066.1 hypothetical protein NDA12_004428 [Ustilago hordei]KAJ1577501.1 hypothetical protein NDA11_002909 [Ustilago hordei]KAJ1582213.1 hypothetical protein NDA15_005556 [Ustilago hordei]KAJ1597880.1 hypothetical protein NDA14_006105 [Ustilago hordei]